MKAKGDDCREHASSRRLVTGQAWLPFLPFPSTLALACHPHPDMSPPLCSMTPMPVYLPLTHRHIQKRASPTLHILESSRQSNSAISTTIKLGKLLNPAFWESNIYLYLTCRIDILHVLSWNRPVPIYLCCLCCGWNFFKEEAQK